MNLWKFFKYSLFLFENLSHEPFLQSISRQQSALYSRNTLIDDSQIYSIILESTQMENLLLSDGNVLLSQKGDTTLFFFQTSI